MLELQLTLQNNQVNVKANGKESHLFPLQDLGQTKKEWEDFLKKSAPVWDETL